MSHRSSASRYQPVQSGLPSGELFRAIPVRDDTAFTYDIVLNPSGLHVASVVGFRRYGAACDDTEAHVSVLAAAPAMLAALLNIVTARRTGTTMPWAEIEAAIFAASGAPAVGTILFNRMPEQDERPAETPYATPPWTRWHVTRLGFCTEQGLIVSVVSEDGRGTRIDLALEEVRHAFARDTPPASRP